MQLFNSKHILIVHIFVLIISLVGINVVIAQPMPLFFNENGKYILNIPYLGYSDGQEQQAFAASLSSSDLQNFSIDSVVGLEALRTSEPLSSVSISSGKWLLHLPYIRVQDSLLIYQAELTAGQELSSFALSPQSVQARFTANATDFSEQLTVQGVNEQSIGGSSVSSSTQLNVVWEHPHDLSRNHYEIALTEVNSQREFRSRVAADIVSTTLTELKSDTDYRIVLYACSDEDCNHYATAQSGVVRTAKEHWQLQGSGNSVSGLTAPVADGNARISATRIGADAGTVNADSVQLYYGPFPQAGANSTLGVATGNISSSNPLGRYLEFTSLAYQAGLISPLSSQPPNQTEPSSQGPTPPTPPNPPNQNIRADSSDFAYINQVATGQGVPLSNGKIRLFFEGLGSDGLTRIFWLDSQDGYVGQDFNSGSELTCSSSQDYAAGGNCEPTVAIGIDGDTLNGNAKLKNARQNKVAFATQKDWRWDMSAGTFMVFTTDKVDGCSDNQMNHGYAVWDGESQWQVQYESDGCPKMFQSAQACFPMHIGGLRYKMYCGDPSQTDGKVTNSSLPFLGPKQLLYADGTQTGDVGVVDFEDWEAQSLVRDVVFVWPDGSQFSVADEGYIDDYHFLAPTGDLSYQVMYLAITDGDAVPVAATAVLLNP